MNQRRSIIVGGVACLACAIVGAGLGFGFSVSALVTARAAVALGGALTLFALPISLQKRGRSSPATFLTWAVVLLLAAYGLFTLLGGIMPGGGL